MCNPCEKKRVRCKYRKQLYHAKKAQQEYEALLSESREGIPLRKESFYEMDRLLSEGVKRGQHLYHIMQTKELGVSKSTVYRHLKRGYLSVSPLDFPRMVKFKAAGILLNDKTAAETARNIRSLKIRFAAAGLCFGSILPLILTDYAEKKTMPKNR